MAGVVVIGLEAIGGVLAALAHERGHYVAFALHTRSVPPPASGRPPTTSSGPPSSSPGAVDLLRVRSTGDGLEREVGAGIH